MGAHSMLFKCFAYGSNMLTERLLAAAVPIGVGSIRGYTLQFWKASKGGSGKGWPRRCSERTAGI
jgi:hypothetical protein